MPRRKQILPKKHGNGEDGTAEATSDGATTSSSTEETGDDDQDSVSTSSNQSLGGVDDCTSMVDDPRKSDTPLLALTKDQQQPLKDDEVVLDLSCKKRKISQQQPNFGSSPSSPPKLIKAVDPEDALSTHAQLQTPFLMHGFPTPVQSPLTPNGASSLNSLFNLATFRPSVALTAASGTPSNDSSRSSQASQLDALSKLSSLVSKVGSGSATSPSTSHDPHQTKTGPVRQLATSPTSLIGRLTQELSSSRSLPAPPCSDLRSTTGAGGPFSAGDSGINFQDLWWKFVKKEENAEMKRLNEAKQIFTCLQCQTSFQTMDQLVKHMEATQHYTNIPKHYSWSLQYARQKMRQMKMKMKYSDKMMYFCFLCQSPFTEPVQVHFNLLHSMHNPAENMKYVQIMPSMMGGACSSGPAHLNPTNNDKLDAALTNHSGRSLVMQQKSRRTPCSSDTLLGELQTGAKGLQSSMKSLHQYQNGVNHSNRSGKSKFKLDRVKPKSSVPISNTGSGLDDKDPLSKLRDISAK